MPCRCRHHGIIHCPRTRTETKVPWLTAATRMVGGENNRGERHRDGMCNVLEDGKWEVASGHVCLMQREVCIDVSDGRMRVFQRS